MQTKNYLVGVFDDEDILMKGLKQIRAAGIKIEEVYSPFPIHGIDDVLGYKRSRLPRVAFGFGVIGLSLAIIMQVGMLGIDWPMIIGGKPFIATPDFIPVSFELTVLIASLGMVTTFLIASNLYPGSQKMMLDPRCTDDKFIVAIDLNKNRKMAPTALGDTLRQHGATEINLKEVEL